jgi:hypothetical protein
MTANLTILEEDIKSDIDERQQLMLQIKTLYLRYQFNEKDEKLFLIYSMPAIYAIWEGFIQSTFKTYVQEINKVNLSVDTVCKPILCYHIENSFKQFREYPKDHKRKVTFFDKLGDFYSSDYIEITRIINTESNVGFDVLNRLLSAFNLEKIPEYLEQRYSLKKELDEKLLGIRNKVSHGQDSIIVNRNDLDESIKLVNILMELVLERTKTGFSSQSYRIDDH